MPAESGKITKSGKRWPRENQNFLAAGDGIKPPAPRRPTFEKSDWKILPRHVSEELLFLVRVNSRRPNLVLHARWVEYRNRIAVADPKNTALDHLRVSGHQEADRYNAEQEAHCGQQIVRFWGEHRAAAR